MKKRTIILAMALLLIIPLAALSFTLDEWMRASTNNSNTDTQILAKPGYFYGMVVHTDGTNPVEIDVYDASDESVDGTLILNNWFVTTSSTDRTQSISFLPPVVAELGIQIDVSSLGTVTFDVYFRASDD